MGRGGGGSAAHGRHPAAQRIEDYGQRGNARLLELADDRSFAPSRIDTREDPPFPLIGIRQADGGFIAVLGVDDRAAACFGLTREELAARYRDQLRQAIITDRESRTLAFREGDRVVINGVLRVVQDRALLVTRLQTPRNELVSIPNATVSGPRW